MEVVIDAVCGFGSLDDVTVATFVTEYAGPPLNEYVA